MYRVLLGAMVASAALPTEAQVFATALARMDADGDGRLTAAEYGRFDGQANFVRMDTDRDGAVTAAELAAWVKITPPRPQHSDGVVTPTGFDPALGILPYTGGASGSQVPAVAPIVPPAGTPQGPPPAGMPQGPPPGTPGRRPGPAATAAAPRKAASARRVPAWAWGVGGVGLVGIAAAGGVWWRRKRR